jgi:hypothetical protein
MQSEKQTASDKRGRLVRVRSLVASARQLGEISLSAAKMRNLLRILKSAAHGRKIATGMCI